MREGLTTHSENTLEGGYFVNPKTTHLTCLLHSFKGGGT